MAYTEMVMMIRKLYQDCRLVHGDLSEYNILFHQVSIDGNTSGKNSCGCLPNFFFQATSQILHMRRTFADFAACACAGLSSQINSMLLSLYCWIWAMFSADFV
jgi:hypothetical protein